MLADCWRWTCPTYYLLARLKEAGLIAEMEKGIYLVMGFQPEQELSNLMLVAIHLVAPPYVTYWSALHYYGFTEQSPLTVFAVTTRRIRDKIL